MLVTAEAVSVPAGRSLNVRSSSPCLETYFADERVIRALCRRRLREARAANEKVKLARLVGARIPSFRSEVARYLPPRRTWNSFRPRRRPAGGQTDAQLVAAMSRHALREIEHGRYDWAQRLRQLVREIRGRALTWTDADTITHDKIMPIPKGARGSGEKYRVVVGYDLVSGILASCFSAYLRDLVDSELAESCLAFRRSAGPGLAPPSHHDAVGRIERYRKRVGVDAPIFVAEADIRSFFDSVSHQVVVNQLNALLVGAGLEVDDRAVDFILSLLSGYDLVGEVLPAARAKLAARGVVSPVMPNPLAAFDEAGIPRPHGRVGIPQGSALSGTLANVVLAAADRAVLDVLGSSKKLGLYLRFCDDSVILHSDRAVCAAAFEAYLCALKRLRLPVHQPVVATPYGRRFWSFKSKAVYRWSMDDEPNAAPWLGFVGYQVRRDGVARIRRASITRHRARLHSDVAEWVGAFDRQYEASGESVGIGDVEQLVAHFERHIEAVGVGWPYSRLGFTVGFIALDGEAIDTDGLRLLDQERRRAVKSFRTRILSRVRSGIVRVDSPDGRQRKRRKGGLERSYFGQYRAKLRDAGLAP